MTRFLPFTEEEILVARADTGPCHPECEGMRVMEGRWVATLDAERAGRKSDLETMRTMEEHWTASMDAKHASYVELRDLLRRAICEFIEPVVISHMSKDTQYRTDAEIFLRACLPIVFGPGETAFGLKPDKPGEGAALLDTLHEEGVIRAMLDLTRDASGSGRDLSPTITLECQKCGAPIIAARASTTKDFDADFRAALEMITKELGCMKCSPFPPPKEHGPS
ncbi:MAG: hypothetical protein OK454_08960 [Thaumarchaeota archaeon]|nr:hypothetical protein [Nitrososphaerota archaeon]